MSPTGRVEGRRLQVALGGEATLYADVYLTCSSHSGTPLSQPDPIHAHLESNFLSAYQPVVIACKGGFRSMMCVLRSRYPTVRRLTVGFDLR